MGNAKKRITYFLIIAIMGSYLFFGPAVYAEEGTGHHNLPPGVYVELTEDFYQALKLDHPDNVKRYHNKSSDEYLRQIAVSSRFMVETNIQILKQQERILYLLESLSAKRPK